MGIIDAYSSTQGSKELKKLGLQEFFSYPKPTKLIKWLLQRTIFKNGIVMDFFAGSSTTADAVMQLNAEDGGHRKFIMVQLPEKTYHTNKDGKKVQPKVEKQPTILVLNPLMKSPVSVSVEQLRKFVMTMN